MMKKIYIPYIVFSLLLMSIFVVTLINDQKKIPHYDDIKNPNKEEVEIKPENTTKETVKDYYIVKKYQNNIFLYDNKNNILKKLDINYNDLREYDKKQFTAGIKLPDISSVNQLIEDFSN